MRENAFFTCQAGRKWLNSTLAAGVAQLAEQLICNQQVAGSSPIASSRELRRSKEGHLPYLSGTSGGVPEWPKGTDCKSVVNQTVGGWLQKTALAVGDREPVGELR